MAFQINGCRATRTDTFCAVAKFQTEHPTTEITASGVLLSLGDDSPSPLGMIVDLKE